jgi:hypothetical protein
MLLIFCDENWFNFMYIKVCGRHVLISSIKIPKNIHTRSEHNLRTEAHLQFVPSHY